MSRMKLLLDVVQDLRSLADSIQTLCNALVEHEYSDSVPDPAPASTPDPAPAADRATSAKKLSIEDVRPTLTYLSQEGFTEMIRNKILSYGATKLGEVDPTHYADLLQMAMALRAAYDPVKDAFKVLIDGGKDEEALALLQKYGSSKISGVDPKHYTVLLKDAEELIHAT